MALKYGTPFADLVVYQKVLSNAYEELEAGEYPTNGRLCEDIASLGCAQEIAIEDIFRVKRSFLENRLAARVCESCVFWKECENFVSGDLPVNPEDQFSIEWSPGAAEDSKIESPVTPLMRPGAGGLPMSA